MLASGWLGRRAKNSVSLFQSLEPAFFAHCETDVSWQKAFTALDSAMNEQVRGKTLAAWCTADDAALWRKTMNIVISLAGQLFDGQRHNLADQIERLQSTLDTLGLQDVQRDEREIIQRIKAALQSFVDPSELELEGEEVGEVLNSLIRQRDELENHERITVTGPESLDGLQKDIVYYLGVDEHRVPREPGDKWPLAEMDVTENQLQERYLFLAVVRAAKERLHMTYAEIDDHQACGPSLYLDEIMRTLGRGPVPLAERPGTGEREELEIRNEPVVPVQRHTYTVGELAQFQVCPRRYHLQRLAHTASYYRDSWQIQFLIQGALLSSALAIFRVQHPSGVPAEDFPDIMTGAAFDAALAGAKAIYTGYTADDWFFCAQQTRSRLSESIIWIKERWVGLTVVVEMSQGESVQHRYEQDRTINMFAPARFIIYGRDRGRPSRYVYTSDLLAEEWLLPSINDGTMDSRYRAVRWWSELIKNIVKYSTRVRLGDPVSISVNGEQKALPSMQEIIGEIEKGMYQALPGKQCDYCPVKSLCLGWQTGGLL